jgi:hypothetical protein
MWSPRRSGTVQRAQRLVLLAVAVAVATAVTLWPGQVLSHETLTTTVLFDREIVGILNRHCVMCHVEGGPSFPLATYEQTWVQGRKIRADVIARHMPPWAAFPGYGRFVNENTVTLRESQFIVSWVEGLGPRNAGTVFTNTADTNAPKPQVVRAHLDLGRWQLGEPDLTRQLEATTIEPEHANIIEPEHDVKHTVVDLGLTSERRVSALEYMPGDRRVVRAAFFSVQETGQWIGSWTPWYGFVKLPSGAAFRLQAGSHIVAEIHYQRAKEKVVDRGTLGLFFAARPAPHSVSDLVLEARGDVPAGVPSQRFHAESVLAANTAVLALRPDVLPGVKSVEVSARKPDGGTEILLFAKEIPIDWPTPYIFKDAVSLPKGTALSTTVYYANDGAAPRRAGVRLTVSRYQKTVPAAAPVSRRITLPPREH